MVEAEQVFIHALTKFSQEHFSPRRLLVALSGGLDSIVLLHLCFRLFPERTQALHVNHGYAAAADDWQSHCQRLCDQLQLPLIVQQLPAQSEPLQEARARELRYQIFAAELKPGDLLLLAHHLDDQAETLLLHLLQGRGVFGMPQSRPVGPGRLLRPLLETSRQTLLEYAQAQSLTWVEDPSNSDIRHDRNYLRAHIMPLLGERFTLLPKRLARAGSQVQALAELLQGSLQLEAAELPISVLTGRPESQQVAIVRSWLAAGDLRQPGTTALAGFLSELQLPVDRQPTLSVSGGSLRRYRQQLYFVPEFEADHAPRQITGAEVIELPQGSLQVMLSSDSEAPGGSLLLQFWSSSAMGMHHHRQLFVRGHYQQIAELLREAGIPPWQREGYPLVCDQHGVVSLPGIARSDAAAKVLGGVEFAWWPRTHRR